MMQELREDELTGIAARQVHDARKHAERMAQSRHTEQAITTVILALTGFQTSLAELQSNEKIRSQTVERLQSAVKRERGKARSGSRSYDFNRHVALYQALRTITGQAGG